ncbi:hypothetical protein CC79DRAFT_908054 [Sarocladium strictum]
MAGNVDSSGALPTGVKACRTCRIRRIKCDKAFPICRKCSSTGRQCDGYGIWGGGSRAPPSPLHPKKAGAMVREGKRIASVRQISMLSIPLEDRETLEWFQDRTLRKIPGMFKSDFWDILLLQASATEPAVMHGILALSSVHRCGVTLEIKSLLSNGNAGRYWTSGLHHYVEAIYHLRQRVSSYNIHDRTTLRVLIITCMVFVCVELLSGQVESAQAHLRSGLRLLREAEWLNHMNEPILKTDRSFESVDQWIVEIFCRLHLHNETFNLFFLGRCSIEDAQTRALTMSVNTDLPSTFSFQEEAWAAADQLFLAAIYLTQDCKAASLSGCTPTSDQSLVRRRIRLLSDLSAWSGAFDKSKQSPFKMARGEYDVSPNLIQMSFTLATILTETSLQGDDEMVYDQHTENFRILLDCTDDMIRIYKDQARKKKMLKVQNMSFTIFDICTLPVFYFAATKCREFRLRRQALAGLSVLLHRECHWDGWLTYKVAKKAVELEQGFTYDGSSAYVPLYTPVPTSSRLHNLRVATTGDPYTMLRLEFTRTNGSTISAGSVHLDIRSGMWSEDTSTAKPQSH